MSKTPFVTVIGDDILKRSAHVLGESSAAKKAVDELQRRKGAGEDAVAYLFGNRIIVGPRVWTEGATSTECENG